LRSIALLFLVILNTNLNTTPFYSPASGGQGWLRKIFHKLKKSVLIENSYAPCCPPLAGVGGGLNFGGSGFHSPLDGIFTKQFN
jgi:hypothetical protein